MKTVTESITVAEYTLRSVDAMENLAQPPMLYGPFEQEYLPQIWPLIRRNGKDNIVFNLADGSVYVLEARDFKADKRAWGFAKRGERIRVGDLTGTIIDVDNEWFTGRHFEQNRSLAGLEAMAAEARENKTAE